MKNKNPNCLVCNKPMYLKDNKQFLIYRNTEIKLVTPTLVCDCHNAQYTTDEMDSKAIKKLKKIYRKYFKK